MNNPKQILVVDDELDMELLVNQKFKKQIQSGEYVFSYSTSPESALSAIDKGWKYDVILTDMNFGTDSKMNGFDFIQKLQSLNVKSKIIAVSAFLDINTIRRVMNFGAFDFLIKPIDFDDLGTTINRALEQKTETSQKVIKWEYSTVKYHQRKDFNSEQEYNDTIERVRLTNGGDGQTENIINPGLESTLNTLIENNNQIVSVIPTATDGGYSFQNITKALIVVNT